ncbi:hypothetical protein SAMN04488061_3563 [Filomicrobium insigne]|uniref:Uncharacterized protein n=1 Tax=Filomicrobium insigne TaxID=418854 RepID=A0A1H0UBJ8_9HYPH|nr:hypothetical protein SAMN04488061_3563 [Filomicrobium insigne]
MRVAPSEASRPPGRPAVHRAWLSPVVLNDLLPRACLQVSLRTAPLGNAVALRIGAAQRRGGKFALGIERCPLTSGPKFSTKTLAFTPVFDAEPGLHKGYI